MNSFPAVRDPSVVTKEQLEADIKMDLQYILEKNLDELITKYASYVDSLRTMLEEKGVTTDELRAYLLSLPAFNSNHRGKQLKLMSDMEQELEQKVTSIDIFIFLTTRYASFLNYGVYQQLLENYNVFREGKRELKYPQYHEDYIKKHKVTEYIKVNPLPKNTNGFTKLIVKYNVPSTCTLWKVKELGNYIADMMNLNPLALHMVDFKEGSCVFITFNISVNLAEILFTPDTVFTPQQEDELRARSVQYFECAGHTFNF